MKQGNPPILLFALLVLMAAPAASAFSEESPQEVCIASVGQMPVSCPDGNITADSGIGACRSITCTDDQAQLLEIMACDKPDAADPQYFEMYKQAENGSLRICLGTTCISDNGYAHGLFPACSNHTNNQTNGNETPNNQTEGFCGDELVTGEEECDTFAPAGYMCTEGCLLEPTDGEVCSIATLNATCVGGTKVADTTESPAPIGCRIVACANGDATQQVLVCPKNGVFEMYKQSATQNLSTMPNVCIEGVCIGDWGYKLINTTCDEEPEVPPVCMKSVEAATATCTGGSIVQDDFRGCRTVSCVNDGSALRIFACDKPDGGPTSHFEMYKHFEIGEKQIQLCLDGTCLKSHDTAGFARGNISACGLAEPKDTSAEMHIAPWYPQGNNYIFVCSAHNFIPESYTYDFGDGSMLPRIPNTNVYHTFMPGHYNVTCSATDGMRTESAMLHIEVAGPAMDEE